MLWEYATITINNSVVHLEKELLWRYVEGAMEELLQTKVNKILIRKESERS